MEGASAAKASAADELAPFRSSELRIWHHCVDHCSSDAVAGNEDAVDAAGRLYRDGAGDFMAPKAQRWVASVATNGIGFFDDSFCVGHRFSMWSGPSWR